MVAVRIFARSAKNRQNLTNSDLLYSLLGKVQCYLGDGPNGYVDYDPTEEQLEQARAGAGIVFEEYRSPDSLWIFRKSSIKSE